MFLDLIRRRNPRLIEAAIALHQSGQLPANTYVIDLDAVEDNARAISSQGELARPDRDGDDQTDGAQRILLPRGHAGRNRAKRRCRSGMRVWRRSARAWSSGISATSSRFRNGRPTARPGSRRRWWTVFNAEKAAEAAAASERLGREQPLLARIRGENDQFYRGHEGGFPASEIVAVAAALDKIPAAASLGLRLFRHCCLTPRAARSGRRQISRLCDRRPRRWRAPDTGGSRSTLRARPRA